MKRIDVKGKKNTPKLRLQIYKAALEYYQISFNCKFGFCNTILSVIRNVNLDSLEFDPYKFDLLNRTTLQDYPELLKYEPEIFFNNSYWFNIYSDGIEQRIKILETIIKDMEEKK